MLTRLSAGLRDRSRARLDGPLEILEAREDRRVTCGLTLVGREPHARGPSPSSRDADVESAEDKVGTCPAPRVFEGNVRVIGLRSAKEALRREGIRQTPTLFDVTREQ